MELNKIPNIIGTDISPKTEDIPYNIVWDFNKSKDEWINSMDFIYSNSFDHTCNPIETLDIWMNCLKPKNTFGHQGYCIIEWCGNDGESYYSGADPFGASIEEYKKLIERKYILKDTIKTEKLRGRTQTPCERVLFIITKK